MKDSALARLAAPLLLTSVASAQVFVVCDCWDPATAPCGNAIPTAMFGGCVNSLTTKAVLQGFIGSTSVALDDLLFNGFQLPPGVPGLLFMGDSRAFVLFGDGQLCVTGSARGVFRFPVQPVDSLGLIQYGPGLIAHASVNFGVAGQIAPGDTWYFQYWYRDLAGPCGGGFNLTNAFGVVFSP